MSCPCLGKVSFSVQCQYHQNIGIATVLFLPSLSTSCNIVLYALMIQHTVHRYIPIYTRLHAYLEISHRPSAKTWKTLETFFPSKAPENLKKRSFHPTTRLYHRELPAVVFLGPMFMFSCHQTELLSSRGSWW